MAFGYRASMPLACLSLQRLKILMQQPVVAQLTDLLGRTPQHGLTTNTIAVGLERATNMFLRLRNASAFEDRDSIWIISKRSSTSFGWWTYQNGAFKRKIELSNLFAAIEIRECPFLAITLIEIAVMERPVTERPVMAQAAIGQGHSPKFLIERGLCGTDTGHQ
jgi:hypothetical protein